MLTWLLRLDPVSPTTNPDVAQCLQDKRSLYGNCPSPPQLEWLFQFRMLRRMESLLSEFFFFFFSFDMPTRLLEGLMPTLLCDHRVFSSKFYRSFCWWPLPVHLSGVSQRQVVIPYIELGTPLSEWIVIKLLAIVRDKHMGDTMSAYDILP